MNQPKQPSGNATASIRRVGLLVPVFAVLALSVLVLLYVNRSGTKTGGRDGATERGAQNGKIQNVLIVSIDTCRADYLSSYGYGQETTPNIDAVAAEAYLFENAISPVPLTLPGHATMMTGTNPSYHGIHDNGWYQLDPSNVTLAEILKSHGFTTGAVVGSYVLDRQFGLDRGFDTYDDNFDNEVTPVYISERRAEEVSRHAIDWIDRHQGERFFLFVHYYDPHKAYDAPEPFKSRFAGDVKSQYAGEIAYVDHHVGRLLDRLKQLSLHDSTLIVISSDHGEMLGEHGELTHGFFVYQSALKVPLIIKLPGSGGARRVSELVGLIDIVPTVCSALGIEGSSAVQGVDLLGYLAGQASSQRERRLYCESVMPTKYEAGALMGIVTNRWKYIHAARAELYDLVADPLESQNLLTTHGDEAKGLYDELTRYLTAWRRDAGGRQTAMDEQTRARLESLGYAAGLSVSDDLSLEAVSQKDDAKDVLAFHYQHVMLWHLIRERKYDEAKPLARQMLEHRPEYVDGYLRLAQISREQGQLTEAVGYLQQAVAVQPDNALAHCKLGAMLAAIDKPGEAESHLAVALSIHPQFNLALVEMGKLLQSLGRLDQAAKYFRQAITINPGYALAHYQLARLLSTDGKTVQAAIHYRRALKADPQLYNIYNDLGYELVVQGKQAEAIQCFRKAIEHKADSPAGHYNLANLLRVQRQFEQAVYHYRQAIESNPHHAEAHNNLGDLLRSMGKYDEAVEHFYRVTEMSPDDVVAHHNLAMVRQAQGRLDDAIDELNLVLQIDPDFIASRLRLGRVLQLLGRFEEAEQQYEHCLALKPDNAEMHYHYGVMLKAAGRTDEAIEQWRQTLDISPKSVVVINDLAWTLATASDAQVRNPNEAIVLAEQAVALTQRRHAPFLDTLAAAYASDGQFERAAATAQRAIGQAKAADSQANAEPIRKRMELYRSDKPYIEAPRPAPSTADLD